MSAQVEDDRAVFTCAALRDRWQVLEGRKWNARGEERLAAFVAADTASRDYLQACCAATGLSARLRADAKAGRPRKPEVLQRLIALVGEDEAQRAIELSGPPLWWFEGQWPRQPASRA